MKLGYTILYVPDVEQTVAFYERAFGLKRTFLHESGYGEMTTGETKLAFATLELARSNGVSIRPAQRHEPSPAFEIAFVTDNVAAAFANAVEAGAEPLAEPTQKPWGQTVSYVRDLNGFLVELCSPVNTASTEYAIRPVVPSDTSAILDLSATLGFGPDELEVLQRTFDDLHSTNAKIGYQALAYEENNLLLGVVYYMPMEMTDRAWELVMIVVDPARQGEGIGRRMILAMEEAIRASEGRILVIETSTSPDQERARRFYRKLGYSEVAEIPDAFADGEGKVIFTKHLAESINRASNQESRC